MIAPHSLVSAAAMSTTPKNPSELLAIADEALRSQPGCETARVVTLAALPHAKSGRNWEIPTWCWATA
jgi:hypothetical protein